jgi:hypothetical protein
VLLPTAAIYQEFRIRGRRYPLHLSDGPTAGLDIEVQPGVGGAVPRLSITDAEAHPARKFAVETVQPSALAFDTHGFLKRIDEFEVRSQAPVRCCYLTRDPVESLRSHLACKERDPSWSYDFPPSTAHSLYLRSFEVLHALISTRSGPAIEYETLCEDPAGTVSRLYRWLWPELDGGANDVIAARATIRCRREVTENEQMADLFDSSANAPDGLSLLLGTGDNVPVGAAEALAECRRMRWDISRLQFDIDSIHTE